MTLKHNPFRDVFSSIREQEKRSKDNPKEEDNADADKQYDEGQRKERRGKRNVNHTLDFFGDPDFFDDDINSW